MASKSVTQYAYDLLAEEQKQMDFFDGLNMSNDFIRAKKAYIEAIQKEYARVEPQVTKEIKATQKNFK